MMRVVIVASGPSARGFIPPVGATVIAVNGAIEWLPRADHFFTLDPSPDNLRRLHNRVPGTRYHIALHRSAPAVASGVERWNRINWRDPEPKAKGSPDWWLWRWSAKRKLTRVPGCINTGNSAWGALGLAYHLGAERVALMGVDADQSERIGGGRPNDLSHLPLLFESALGQIDFINCGRMRSAVPKMTVQDGMRWLMN